MEVIEMQGMGIPSVQFIIIALAVLLIILAIQVAIIQYFIRYGVKYYFRMKSMNEPETQKNENNDPSRNM
ncbi:MAG: hypothetical protein IKF90_07145 [Parasporobacterium sp.]|nr:hypothetical protein [Parasporobacterium sp.]